MKKSAAIEAPAARTATRGGCRGITLVELLGVLFIIGLLVLAASPFLRTMSSQGMASAVSREVYADMVRARSEAVKTKLPHMVEFCGGGMEDAGYMVIQCTSGYDCGVWDVCSMIMDDDAEANQGAAIVKLEVNLTRGMRTAEGQRQELKALTSVRFGWQAGGAIVDRPTKGTVSSSTPSSNPRTFGIDLPGTGEVYRFYFKASGQVGDDTAMHNPGGGALYVRAASNKDSNFVRAIDISSTGGLRVNRWDSAQGKWR